MTLGISFPVDLRKELGKLHWDRRWVCASSGMSSALATAAAHSKPGCLVRIGLDAEGLVGPGASDGQLTARLTKVANRMGASRAACVRDY